MFGKGMCRVVWHNGITAEFTTHILCWHPTCGLLIQLAQAGIFPDDVVERSRRIQAEMAVGAYTDSVGNPFIRELVAQGVSARDGHAASPDHIFMSGAMQACFCQLPSPSVRLLDPYSFFRDVVSSAHLPSRHEHGSAAVLHVIYSTGDLPDIPRLPFSAVNTSAADSIAAVQMGHQPVCMSYCRQ